VKKIARQIPSGTTFNFAERPISSNLFYNRYYYLEKKCTDEVFDSYELRVYSCIIHGENDFAEGSKILLDTDLKIILLNHQNNFIRILKVISNAAKNFDILASLSILHNYFDSSTKLLFC